MKRRLCALCSFYSPGHAACFHPDVWSPANRWSKPKPGDPLKLNPHGKCKLYDPNPPGVFRPSGKTQARGLEFTLRKFLARLRGKK